MSGRGSVGIQRVQVPAVAIHSAQAIRSSICTRKQISLLHNAENKFALTQFRMSIDGCIHHALAISNLQPKKTNFSQLVGVGLSALRYTCDFKEFIFQNKQRKHLAYGILSYQRVDKGVGNVTVCAIARAVQGRTRSIHATRTHKIAKSEAMWHKTMSTLDSRLDITCKIGTKNSTVKHGIKQTGLIRKGAMGQMLQLGALVVLTRVEQILE